MADSMIPFDIDNLLKQLRISEQLTGQVHAVCHVLDDNIWTRASTAFVKVAFVANIEGHQEMYLVHVYGDFTLFVVGHILTLCNTTFDGSVLYCNETSTVHR